MRAEEARGGRRRARRASARPPGRARFRRRREGRRRRERGRETARGAAGGGRSTGARSTGRDSRGRARRCRRPSPRRRSGAETAGEAAAAPGRARGGLLERLLPDGAGGGRRRARNPGSLGRRRPRFLFLAPMMTSWTIARPGGRRRRRGQRRLWFGQLRRRFGELRRRRARGGDCGEAHRRGSPGWAAAADARVDHVRRRESVRVRRGRARRPGRSASRSSRGPWRLTRRVSWKRWRRRPRRDGTRRGGERVGAPDRRRRVRAREPVHHLGRVRVVSEHGRRGEAGQVDRRRHGGRIRPRRGGVLRSSFEGNATFLDLSPCMDFNN